FRAMFAEGSGFAKAGGALKPLEGGPLAGLPSGPFAFAIGGAMPDKAMQALMSWNLEMMKGLGIAEEKLQKLEKAYAQTSKGLRGMGMLLQVGKANDPLFGGFVMTYPVDDAKAYLERYEKGTREAAEILKGANLPFTPVPQVTKVKVEGMTALEISMDFGDLANEEAVKKILDKLIGGAKLTMSM